MKPFNWLQQIHKICKYKSNPISCETFQMENLFNVERKQSNDCFIECNKDLNSVINCVDEWEEKIQNPIKRIEN